MLNGDNFAVVIPMDYKEHTETNPFCDLALNPTCPCREDQTSLQTLHKYIQEGLLTVEEAQRTYEGKMLL